MTNNSTFPGLAAISDRIFIRSGERAHDEQPPKEHPRAKQIAVLSPISQAFLDNVSKRPKHVLPVIKEVFPEGTKDATDGSVLLHVVSNAGGVNYVATLNAYKELYSRPLPHVLTIYDSTPGNPVLNWANLKRWSYAMALGTAEWFPWPFCITQCLWGFFLCMTHSVDYVAGREPAPMFSKRVFLDEEYESKQSTRLFLYSKEDIPVPFEQLEKNNADARELSYEVDSLIFKGSGHVGHMRKHPEQYWGTVEHSWANAHCTFVSRA